MYRPRFNTTGESGHQRVATHVQDRYIVTSHLWDRFLTASVTAQNIPGIHNNRISGQTVINRLK